MLGQDRLQLRGLEAVAGHEPDLEDFDPVSPVALDRGRVAAVAWGVAAASFVVLFLVLPGSELWRASLAFALGMAAGTLLLAAALVWEARSA